ncbi:MAG: gas vesicle protein [Nocardioidaceae bacterium]
MTQPAGVNQGGYSGAPYRAADIPGHGRSPDSLADVLERVLDKGIVIVGDIQVRLLDIELLTIKVRLLVASVDKAREMGINWWESDEFVTAELEQEDDEGRALRERVNALEGRLKELGDGQETQDTSTSRSTSSAARSR